jgi:hypothetical protein
VSHLIREYGTNGIYLDEMWPYGCANAEHGCGYVGAAGKRRITYPLRALLETYRRLRAVFATTGRPFYIAYHISGGRVPPLPTFGDSLLLAEDRNPLVRLNPDYTENVSPAQMRAGYAPEAWGIPVVFIPQFKMNNDWMKDPDLAAKLMAMLVPHDVMVWPIFAETSTLLQYRSALERFGIGETDVEFYPYWRTHPAIQCKDDRVKLSVYVRPSKLLLCIANWSKEEVRDVGILLNKTFLKLPRRTVARDAVTGETMIVPGNTLTLMVPAKRVRLVEVGR